MNDQNKSPWELEKDRVRKVLEAIDRGATGLLDTIRGVRLYGHQVKGAYRGRLLAYWDVMNTRAAHAFEGLEESEALGLGGLIRVALMERFPVPAISDAADYVEVFDSSKPDGRAMVLKDRWPARPPERPSSGPRFIPASTEHDKQAHPWATPLEG